MGKSMVHLWCSTLKASSADPEINTKGILSSACSPWKLCANKFVLKLLASSAYDWLMQNDYINQGYAEVSLAVFLISSRFSLLCPTFFIA